jgi:hypothetical protein
MVSLSTRVLGKEKSLKQNKKILAVWLGLSTGLLLSFQNCGKAPLVSESYEGSPIPIYHPDEKPTTPSYQSALLANKNQVSDLLQSIFAKPGVVFPQLESLIHQWIITKPGEFGGSCNMYDSYSTVDCGGGVSNVNLPFYADGNPLRESNRLQFCQRILSIDTSLDNALFNVGLVRTMEPSRANISLAYELFYRGEDFSSPESQNVLNSLVELNAGLANPGLSLPGENTTDRWRAILLTVCESAGWQLF